MRILHITAHLGGGVGRALSSIVTHEKKKNPLDEHVVLLLDNPEKRQFIDICGKGGVSVLLQPQRDELRDEIRRADIVVAHWWHHPVMARFLSEFPQVPARLVLWAHVNGCNYPCLPFEFVDLPQKTFFTSPFSFENPLWSERQRNKVRKDSAVVYGLGELEFHPPVRKNRSKEFVIGYVGTLNSSKLHPQFVEFCHAVLKKIPTAQFVLVGDVNQGNDIMQKARAYHIDGHFKFTGYSHQITEELAKFDVFAYPLNPRHFGTTENVLLEAMAFGLPVVALNHNTEKYLIKGHRKVGLLADSIEHYASSIRYLYDHPEERVRIGANAREYVRSNFTFEKNVEFMRYEFRKVLKLPRKQFNFRNIFGAHPWEWFTACLGEDKETFCGSIDEKISIPRREVLEHKIRSSSPILREKTKSSIAHFAETFPKDSNLQYWRNVISRKTSNMNSPLVSIGLPTYNRLDGLRRALDCFTTQTYPNLEIIVSDNCSPQDPSEMVRSYAEKDPRIKYFRQKNNIGMGKNGEFIWERASGKYFLLGSDDDWWAPDFVAELVGALRSEDGAVCAFCDFEEVDEAGRKIASMSRYYRARKALGMKIHSYPNHYPLLREFSCNDFGARLKNFILQKEYDGKANVHRSICDRKVFIDSVAKLRNLGLWECWAFDQLLAFTMLTHGSLAISDKILFKCRVGNQKHYVDPRSRLEYLKGYIRVIDSCCKGAQARELREAVNSRYLDKTVGFFQEYVGVLKEFTSKAASSNDEKSLKGLKQVRDLVAAGNHTDADILARELSAIMPAVSKQPVMARTMRGFFATGTKRTRITLASEILKKVNSRK